MKEKKNDPSDSAFEFDHVSAIASLNYLMSIAKEEDKDDALACLEIAKLSFETAVKILALDKGT